MSCCCCSDFGDYWLCSVVCLEWLCWVYVLGGGVVVVVFWFCGGDFFFGGDLCRCWRSWCRLFGWRWVCWKLWSLDDGGGILGGSLCRMCCGSFLSWSVLWFLYLGGWVVVGVGNYKDCDDVNVFLGDVCCWLFVYYGFLIFVFLYNNKIVILLIVIFCW